jgi:hypothetical protein
MYSRTGLGILYLTAEVKNVYGRVLCSTSKKIDVDCCKKNTDLRAVAIWWENCGSGVSVCKLGPEFKYQDLVDYSLDQGLLYTRPEVKGGCIPFDWSIEGPGSLVKVGDFKDKAFYKIPGPNDPPARCDESLYISVHDRCNNTYIAHAPPCCDTIEGDVIIYYTSLIMYCNQSQDFSVHGGCIPYTWELTGGGGTLTGASGAGLTATYVAPATNPNCANNPTIRVTDCCGNSTQIKLAINCYSGFAHALVVGELLKCCCYKIQNPGCAGKGYDAVLSVHYIDWACDGTIVVDQWAGSRSNCSGVCPQPPPCTNSCPCDKSDDPDCWNNYDCGCASPCPCDTIVDVRTTAMKNSGCCPLNPFTGLPY